MFCTKEGAGSAWQNIQGPQTLQELQNCPNWAKKGMIERNAWIWLVLVGLWGPNKVGVL